MGLASKLGTPAPSAPPLQGQQGGASAPPGYPQINAQPGGAGQPPMQSQPGGQYGAPPSGQYGAPPQSQVGQPGQAPSQPGQGLPGQSQYGRPPQSQYGQPPQGQFGQNPQSQYGQNPQSQYGQTPQSQYGQNPQSQYGQNPQGQIGQPLGTGPPSAQNSFNQGYSMQQNALNQGRPGQQASFNQGHPGMQQNSCNQGQPGMQQNSFNQGRPGQFNQPGGQGIFTAQRVMIKLQQLVQENGLQHFYPPQRLDQVAQFVASKDVLGLGQRWRLPNEVTMDLVGLALYDICIYCDDSGSMAFEEGGERIDDLKAVLGRTADAATLFDTDGIVVRFMNSTIEGNGIHSEAEAANLIGQIRFSGTTPLGTALDRKVMQPMVLGQARSGSMQKPVLVICITDGEPTGEPKDAVRQVIMSAKQQLANTPYGAGAVAFQFAQVGKDAAATRFLHGLDVDPVIGGMVDTTAHFEQEQEEYARKGIQLDPSLYLVKLMVGGIDRSYDEGDE